MRKLALSALLLALGLGVAGCNSDTEPIRPNTPPADGADGDGTPDTTDDDGDDAP